MPGSVFYKCNQCSTFVDSVKTGIHNITKSLHDFNFLSFGPTTNIIYLSDFSLCEHFC